MAKKIRDIKRQKSLQKKREIRAENKSTISSFIYEMIIAYDGYNYGGFARQKHKNTIQNKLDDAISAYLKTNIKTTEASRTDAKVSALNQHVMISTNQEINIKEMKDYLNNNLDLDIQVKDIRKRSNKFHVRYDVKDKTYEYLISKQDDIRFNKKSWYISKNIDIMSMKKASKYLLGKHDFITFRSAKATTDNSIRTINYIEITEDDTFIKIKINADGFLYNMVRLIVFNLVDVGINKYPPEYTKQILEAKQKPNTLESAPAKGLTLLEINY